MNEYRVVFIYADARDNLFIVPTGEAKRLYGGTMEIELIKHLPYPYRDEEVEEALVEAMKLCFTKDPDDAPGYRTAIEKYLNIKGYAKAVKDKKLIEFHWDIDDGYSVIPSQKIPKQGYIDLTDKTIWLGKEIKKGELARALKEAMEISTP